VILGVGLGEIGDTSFRIAHMGHTNAPMVLGTLGAVEMGLKALAIPHGSGGCRRQWSIWDGRWRLRGLPRRRFLTYADLTMGCVLVKKNAICFTKRRANEREFTNEKGRPCQPGPTILHG
jgi:hypothetical protein